jgi:hypothetical protein
MRKRDPVSDITQLAFCQLNQTDQLVVQLLRSEDMAAACRILWPTQPTIVAADAFPETAAVLCKLFAGASVELSRIKAQRWTL